MEEKEPDEILSEEETKELETINLPINVSNLDRYEKNFIFKGTNILIEPKECNKKNIKTLLDSYSHLNEKDKEIKYNQDCNCIRWRYSESGNIITNAKLIEWSDGTFQIQIGDNLYDMISSKISGAKVCTVHKNTLFIPQSNINEKILLKQVKK